MGSKVKNLIEYEGITDSLPSFSKETNPIKELTIEEKCTIPELKPDIEQLLKLETELEIIQTEVIKTPVATSLEEQNLTGWKLAIEAELKQKIQYVAATTMQSVHVTHCNILFSSFIILPPDFDPEQSTFVEGFIENIFVKKLDERNFFENITLLLVATID